MVGDRAWDGMIVVDGPRSVSGDRWLDRLNSPDAGVISVVAGPSHAFFALVLAILSCIGQREAAEMGTQNDREMLRIWAEAYNLTDVIVNHADNYPGSVIVGLEAILVEIRVQLWLVVEPALVEATLVELGRVSVSPPRLGWAAFERRWRERSGEVRKPGTPTTLRIASERAYSAARERIGEALDRRRDVPYLAGFCLIANDSEQLRAYKREAGGRSTSVRHTRLTVAARLRSLEETYRDLACFAQAIHGSGVALRRIGWKVTLDERVLAAGAYRGSVSRTIDSERLAHLRLYRDPQTAAAAAVACLGLAIDEMVGVRIKDVDEDGSMIRSLNDCVPVPAELRPILRAQRISQVRRGAEPNHRFLDQGTRKLSARHAALLVRVGLGLAKGTQPWREILAAPARDERWLLERGVTIRRLKGERARTPARLESDKLRDQAIEELRARGHVPIGAPCLCPRPHVKPRLLNETFGDWRRPPPSPSHPWRTPRLSSQARPQ